MLLDEKELEIAFNKSCSDLLKKLEGIYDKDNYKLNDFLKNDDSFRDLIYTEFKKVVQLGYFLGKPKWFNGDNIPKDNEVIINEDFETMIYSNGKYRIYDSYLERYKEAKSPKVWCYKSDLEYNDTY